MKTLDELMAETEEVGDCVEWQGTMGCAGNSTAPIYKTRIAGKSTNVAVIREVWKFTKGPIPPGKIIYRLCCNSKCIGCLAIGVRGDAMKQKKRLGLAKHSPASRAALTSGARSRVNVKNTVEKARHVRDLAALGVSDAEVAQRTGVSKAMVADIRRGRNWLETSHASSVFSWRPTP